MANPEQRQLDRVEYWQGQMLRAADFRDIEATEAQRRWWHNRAIHNAYGIVRGFAIALETAGTTKVVSVAPGLAYDSFSRELMLPARRTVALPSNLPSTANRRMALVIRYAAPSSISPSDGEACLALPPRACNGTVEFAWCSSDLATPQCGVVLGELQSSGRDPPTLVAPFTPIRSRALAMPTLGNGTTVAGNTPWDPWVFDWVLDDRALQSVIGIQTIVDTSAAGFTDVPAYFAWLEGPLWDPYTRQLVPALFPSITDEAIDSFTFRMWLSRGQLAPVADAALPTSAAMGVTLVSDPDSFITFARQQGLYVAWVGCRTVLPKGRSPYE